MSLHYFQVFYYMNFGINFFLYSLCGRNFRENLGWIWNSIRHKKRSFRAGNGTELPSDATSICTYKLGPNNSPVLAHRSSSKSYKTNSMRMNVAKKWSNGSYKMGTDKVVTIASERKSLTT